MNKPRHSLLWVRLKQGCKSTCALNILSWFREEVFGPVAPVLRFKTEDDALRMANDTNAGNLLNFGSYSDTH